MSGSLPRDDLEVGSLVSISAPAWLLGDAYDQSTFDQVRTVIGIVIGYFRERSDNAPVSLAVRSPGVDVPKPEVPTSSHGLTIMTSEHRIIWLLWHNLKRVTPLVTVEECLEVRSKG